MSVEHGAAGFSPPDPLGGLKPAAPQSVDATQVIADLLARGHAVRFRAAGASMHPIIRGEDYLHVAPLTTPIRRGDVVLTIANRGLTAHRVIAVHGESLVTRGDNAPADDAPVGRDRVLGVVTHAERDGRKRRIRRATSFVLRLQRVIARAIAALPGKSADQPESQQVPPKISRSARISASFPKNQPISQNFSKFSKKSAD